MKVLFALSDDEVSEQIVKRYRKEFKEIISYKNVYYFNAIVKEIQKDKSYDRIVISEDLEQYVTNNINQMDKVIFEKLDAITDEATDSKGKEIPIVFICANNRKKSDYFAVKLFSLGIYNALIGNDREISGVCELLKRPRSKKDAKIYYKIDSEEVSYQSESENDVNETEIQNILAHYKKIGNDEKKCIVSFDDIAEQYNDQQLKLIIKCLPLSVRAILEEKSDRYKEIVLESPSLKLSNHDVMIAKERTEGRVSKNIQSLLGNKEEGIKKEVIIPTNISLKNVKKITDIPETIKEENPYSVVYEDTEHEEIEKEQENEEVMIDFTDTNSEEALQENEEVIIDFTNANSEENAQEVKEETVELPVEEEKPKKGKKEKVKTEKPKKEKKEKTKKKSKTEEVVEVESVAEEQKEPEVEVEEVVDLTAEEQKEPEVEVEEVIDLTAEEQKEPEVEVEEVVDLTVEEQEEPEVEIEEVVDLTAEEQESEGKLELEEYESRYSKLQNNTTDETIQPLLLVDDEKNAENETIEETQEVEDELIEEIPEVEEVAKEMPVSEVKKIEEKLPTRKGKKKKSKDTEKPLKPFEDSEIYASGKKIVAFVGAHQAGTSFLINSLAELLQSKGINTAIFDLTKNRNSYYIYTKNDEDLRNIAMNTTDNLLNDRNSGIKVRRNLFVYTSLPEDEIEEQDIKEMLKKLISKHDLVLIDCDLDTPINCFGYVNEVYLVQNMDILTIQPLTDFLEKLKNANILNDEKFSVIVNKVIPVRGLSPKMIISGMSYYSDSKMSNTKELFNRNEIARTIIPFDERAYSKYLESMVDCDINIVGYSKKFMKSLKEVALKICPHVKFK